MYSYVKQNLYLQKDLEHYTTLTIPGGNQRIVSELINVSVKHLKKFVLTFKKSPRYC